MRRAAFLVATLSACASAESMPIDPFLDSSKGDGHPARLEELDHSKLDMDEPSDLVQVDGKLYSVSDRHSKIYRVKPNGDADVHMNVDGTDLEAIGFDPDRGEFLIADETKSKIWTIDAAGDRHDAIELDNADDGNSGIEGIVVAGNGHLYAVKEKDPARIYELDADGTLLASKKIELADDLSAITYNADDDHLYVLSDEDRSLFRLDKHWNADRAWKLPVDHPEGVAFDGTTLYVVSDGDHRIYTFELVD
ncbi:MAG TPA: SdiA-regulated domain-containing protein [Kofleriaceae bacterium]|nr:SdiA-regulated domain-containing protein [Kofleriaceae bacterium]